MNNSIFVLALALVLAGGLMSCESRNDKGHRVESGAGTRNSDLGNRIRARINSDPELEAANLSIIADADKKEATLSGLVESETLHSKAVALAKGAQSDLKVNDMIEVRPGEISQQDVTEDLAKQEWTKAKRARDRVSTQAEDAWIHAKIVGKLIENLDTPARNIKVDVEHRVVTLRGRVHTSKEKSEAQRVAQETEEVKRVENQLNIGV
jgi:osmotically-inducible protein OsmY